ncbi:MAG: FG-GAP repeat protein [Deltaproteobacteria bacterium]|nr:FG-GAP repeat protein [Deltaproteobacteria bacterium]
MGRGLLAWALAWSLALAVAAGCGDGAATDGGGSDVDADHESAGEDVDADADVARDDAAVEEGTVEAEDAESDGDRTDDDGTDDDGTDDGGTTEDGVEEDGGDEGEVSATCGDGVAEGPEVCDGADFRGDSCIARGYEAGDLVCAWCTIINDSPCRTCGDGLAEDPEECDLSDLRHRDCASFGWGGGELGCTGGCAFDDAACAPTVPVLRRPMNAAYVGSVLVPGSMRPEFSWEPSTSPTGGAVTYELELADDRTFPAGSTVGATTAATSHRPATDLPISTSPPVGRRYWWRVRACAGAICSAWTASWYFTAGASERDLNGDGYADVVVSLMSIDAAMYSHSSVRLYFGGPTGPGATPDLELATGVAGDDFGTHLAIAGDFNGDLCADLAVTSTWAGGNVRVYFGAPVIGPDDTADGLLDGGALGGGWFGTWVGPAGDVNADGYADLVVSASSRAGSGGSGALWVFFGGAGATFDTTPDGSAIGEGTSDRYAPSAGVGDVNGDGYADVGASALWFAPPSGELAGKVYLYHGGPGATFDGTADESLVGFAGTWSYFGNDLAGAGDVDDDGFGDLVIGAWNDSSGGFDTGSVFLFRGGTGTVLDASPDATFHGALQDNLGSRLAAGDVNGDGRPDLLAAGNQDALAPADRYAGVLVAFLGGGWPFDTSADATRRGTAGGERFADTLAWAGDVDGDGFGDVIAGAPGDATGGEFAGAAYLFLGSAASTFDLVPDWTVLGSARDQLGQSVY